MADAYLGEIRMVAFNFAPYGWALCQGQMLSVSQNTALFSLLGTSFGGNGQTTFGLPDLQGRVPLGQGQGAGLPPYVFGQNGGIQAVTLTINNLPAHTHAATFAGTGGSSAPVTVTVQGSSEAGSTPTPNGNFLAGIAKQGNQNANLYITNPPANTRGNIGGVSGGTVAIPAPAGTVTNASTGGSQPVSIEPPYLCVNFAICLQGIYPTRG